MNILIVCTQGQNRSKYLAEYLNNKGYTTNYGGVDPEGFNPLTQNQVDWADVIVAVRERIKDKLIDRFDIKGKRVINLEIKPVTFTTIQSASDHTYLRLDDWNVMTSPDGNIKFLYSLG